jgi:UDP-4-amino-4-deoxy-L-arabinose formyltransferase/UDP-glucuronic acid dehydrogenase (UDP-4-keto-hexauronic acid decarboxylating)
VSVVVLGYHEMGCTGLRALLRRGVPVSAVFTYRDDPDENCWFGSVASLAKGAGIPVFLTEEIHDARWIGHLRALRPDVLFSFYYRHIVRRPILALPRLGAFNLHGSLLPRYRGRCPVNWQLVHGERESGVTLHEMTGRADAGDIVDQERVTVGPDDTALELYQRLNAAADVLLDRQLGALLAGRAPRTPQDESQASVFGGRRPEDGRVDWSWPRARITISCGRWRRPGPAPSASWPTVRSCCGARGRSRISRRRRWSRSRALARRASARAARATAARAARVDAPAGARLRTARALRRGTSARRPEIRMKVLDPRRQRLHRPLAHRAHPARHRLAGLRHGHRRRPHPGHLGTPRFRFLEGDIGINREWIEYHVKACDVVLPLVAIATPKAYVDDPLRVFELDFEENLRIVRQAVSTTRAWSSRPRPRSTACAGTPPSTRRRARSCWARSASSAGSTPAPSSSSTA